MAKKQTGTAAEEPLRRTCGAMAAHMMLLERFPSFRASQMRLAGATNKRRETGEDVAKAKIDGLAKWYGVGAPAFFSVHMEADVAHSETSRDLLRRLCDDGGKTAEARAASARTLNALYGFLDACAITA